MPSKHNRIISSPSESLSGDTHLRDDREPEEEDIDEDMDFSIGLRDAQLKVSKLYKELKKVHMKKATLEAMKSGTHRCLQHTTMGDDMKLAIIPSDPDFDDSDWNSEDQYTSPDMNGSSSDHFIAKTDYGMQQQCSNAAEHVKVMLPLIIDHDLDQDMLLGFDLELKKF
ncbi:hypothetical protein BDQ17DRAFT_1435426 [Cyathus striatus]|nr:hypothetical protein BDQ17DRAFT_1435426 [Cyathus striatus]